MAVALLCQPLLFDTRPAWAQEPTSETATPPYRGVRSEIEIYGFLPWQVTGDASAGDISVGFEADAGDVLDHLEAGAAARGQVWRGPGGLIVDVLWLKFGQDEAVGMQGIPIDIDISRFTADLMFGWVPYRDATAQLQLHAGMRIESTDVDLMVGDASRDDDNDKAKFVAEAEFPLRLDKHWLVRARGTLAVPDGVSFTFLGVAEYQYDWFAVTFGYRYDSIETGGPRVSFDSRMHSIYLALGADFGQEL
jgi:hypothetical protein